MTKRNEVAAALHAHLCVCPKHGYTQGSGRWGNASFCNVAVGRKVYALAGGDRDCSSSVIDCWRRALQDTKWARSLDAATYTGNMKPVFVNSGLFEWHPMSDGYIAQTGDIYLNIQKHTAMCQSAVPDLLSEFYINEYGGIIGGQEGDQTGGESRIVPYYSFPWDGILAYNHKADSKELPESLGNYTDLDPDAWYIPYIREAVEKGWMSGADAAHWQPDRVTSRAMALVALSRKLGWELDDAMPLTDIGTWYTLPVMKAVSLGIVDASSGKFHPDRGCTREEFATFIWRSQGEPSAEPCAEASKWARTAVGWCLQKGIFTGKPRPKEALLRSEAAAMLTRF